MKTFKFRTIVKSTYEIIVKARDEDEAMDKIMMEEHESIKETDIETIECLPID